MNRHEILLAIQDIVNSALKKSDVTLTEQTTAKQVEGWDSLSHMVIISEIEKAMNMKFAFMEIVNMECMGDMIDLIISKQK